jgi:hypothetical protein
MNMFSVLSQKLVAQTVHKSLNQMIVKRLVADILKDDEFQIFKISATTNWMMARKWITLHNTMCRSACGMI